MLIKVVLYNKTYVRANRCLLQTGQGVFMENRKQEEIYDFLKEYVEDKGYPPTVREICEAVSLKSTSTVHGHLTRLERKGLIKRNPLKPRTLEITELAHHQKEMIDIPIIKGYKEGNLLDKSNVEETFPLPIDYIKHDKVLYMIRVSGESMINAGIRDNDLAIMEYTSTAKNCEIVLAQLYDICTIKRYYKEKDCIRLQVENETMQDLIVKECKILGRLVGIYRSYK